MRQQLRAIAIGMGITYEQLTGDLSGVNYSSIRAELIEFRMMCGMLQHNILVFQLCRPVWGRWLELAILSGEIDIGGDWVKKGAKEVKCVPQGFGSVDQLKAQQAQQDQRRASELSLNFDSDVQHSNLEIL